MDPAMPEPSHKTLDLPILELTAERFAPYGSVIAPLEDGAPFGVEDAPLDLGAGTPRFYIMRIPAHGLTVTHIARHRRVTQTLASVGGHTWFLAVAPPRALGVKLSIPHSLRVAGLSKSATCSVPPHRRSRSISLAMPSFSSGKRS
jgi:hypothetical protein